MAREKFQRKWYFFHEKDSNFNSRIIHTSVFLHWISSLKIWVENTVFAIQHTGNRKSFTEVLSPRDQTNPFAYSCGFTFNTSYKNGMIGHGGGGTMSKCSKTIYYKNLLGTYFCTNLLVNINLQ